MMRHATLLAAAALLAACAPQEAAPTGPASRIDDLVQVERAFGDRSADLPPGACYANPESPSAAACLARRIVSLEIVDVDVDGWADVRVGRADGSGTVYLNEGGRFRAQDTPTSSTPAPLDIPPPDDVGTSGRSWAAADLDGDGRRELIVGRGGDASREDSAERHTVMLPPAIFTRDEERWVRVHPLDVERRRMIGFSDLVAAADVTGDLVPDLIIAGEGMAHPQLYMNTADPARFAAVMLTEPGIITVTYRQGGITLDPGARGNIPVTAPHSVGLGDGGAKEATVMFESGDRVSIILEPGKLVSLSPPSR